MLSQEEFDDWCNRLNLSEQARKVIEQVRSSGPSRRVGGGSRNVSGHYASRKMGVTIQFESHKVELPFIYELEHDEDVLEFYDQPPQIKLNYSEDGRNLGFYYTPDFFVIRTNSAGWVECKTQDKLQKLAERNPNRYLLGDDNQWHTLPGEKYAEQFGFSFRLWSNANINWILQRNLSFLEDYYRAPECPPLEKSTTLSVFSLISAQPGITLAQLLHYAEGVTPDDIYFLITNEQIYVDLIAAPLVEPERCFVFRDQQTAFAYRSMVLSQAPTDTFSSPSIALVPGTSICWDGKSLTIDLVGETEILLHTDNKELVELALTTFEHLVREGKITSLRTHKEGSLSAEVREFLIKASLKDLEEANRRYRIIEPYLREQPLEDNTVPKRTLRYWKAKYRQAEQKYGYGYIGLLSFNCVKGNCNRKLPEYTLELIDKFIAEDYETHKQKRKLAVYGDFAYACSQAGIPDNQIPTYKTFIKEIKRRSGYEQTLKREGRRAAYSQEPLYWELKLTTPRHGDRPFEICHIDHTQLDIELRCSLTGRVLGRPWVTFLIDARSRRILAIYITYDPPSYRSCMMVLRICVKRHGRLPQIIVTDNGAEFHSTYFQSLLALFECTLKYRPPSKARFNAVGERLFGTSCTQLIYNLAGNTQIMKKVRQMSKSVNPKNLALWTLGLLYFQFCEWAYGLYDMTEHPALGQSPQEAFVAGITQYGSRSHRMIPYDENFRILTLPTTQQGKAKVQPGLGVKIQHKYYWSNAFRDPEIEKTRIDVRYDPWNAGVAYAYVRGQWVECISENYPLFRGRSEKEIQLASAELQKRQQNHAKQFRLRAKQLGAFLSSIEAEEVLLEQRLRDAQALEVFRVIEGGLPNRSPYGQSQEIDKGDDNKARESSTRSESNEPINPNKLKVFKSY